MDVYCTQLTEPFSTRSKSKMLEHETNLKLTIDTRRNIANSYVGCDPLSNTILKRWHVGYSRSAFVFVVHQNHPLAHFNIRKIDEANIDIFPILERNRDS